LQMAVLAASRLAASRRSFHQELGRAGDLYRAVLRPFASVRPHCCGDLVHALLAVPTCKFQFRACMGGGSSEAR